MVPSPKHQGPQIWASKETLHWSLFLRYCLQLQWFVVLVVPAGEWKQYNYTYGYTYVKWKIPEMKRWNYTPVLQNTYLQINNHIQVMVQEYKNITYEPAFLDEWGSVWQCHSLYSACSTEQSMVTGLGERASVSWIYRHLILKNLYL